MAAVSFNKQSGAKFKLVKIPVSTGKGDGKVSKEIDVEVPATLEDAVKAEGTQNVFRRYIGSLVINLQAQARNEIRPEGEKSERKRANYMEELGI